MDNLVRLTSNCYIVYTQSGWKKLLKRLNCYGNNARYMYYVTQHTHDENVFEYYTAPYATDIKRKRVKQYPIKYPCVISYEDDTFEQCSYYIFIKYITKDLKFSDIKNEDYEE